VRSRIPSVLFGPGCVVAALLFIVGFWVTFIFVIAHFVAKF
jgi:hypothetical protein